MFCHRIFDEVANELVLSSEHFPKYGNMLAFAKRFCGFTYQQIANSTANQVKLKMRYMYESVTCQLLTHCVILDKPISTSDIHCLFQSKTKINRNKPIF